MEPYNLLNIAIKYHESGLTCMPAKATKNPNADSYKEFNKEPTPLEIVKTWRWDHPETHGVGILTGAASGDLIVLDFDTKYDPTGNLYERWLELVPKELYERLVIASSRTNGKHVYFRSPGSVTKNIKLANRHTTNQERDKAPDEKVKVLIETRGNGGYIICAPTPGYSWLQGDQSTIPSITAEQEALLLDSCRYFNQVLVEFKPKLEGTSYRTNPGLDPTEDYDNKADLNGLLMSHGWEFVSSHGSKDHYKRPGDTKARTSGNYDHEKKWFSVFTTSSQFETGKAYRPWMVYSELEHNGDCKAAWRALKDQGYGKAVNYDRKVVNKLKSYIAAGNTEEIHKYLEISFADPAKADAHLAKAKEPVTVIENSFWILEVDDKGKEKLVINAAALIEFMTLNGFYKHYPTGNIEPVYIRIVSGIASEINIHQIVDFITDYIYSLPYEFDGITRTRLYNLLFHASGSYFSDAKTVWLQNNRRQFIKDTATTAFVFFTNCIAKVTAGLIEITDYSALGDNIVWKNQVKQHSFTYEENSVCVFQNFMELISVGPGRYETNAKILGYLMHRYKNPGKAFAIIGCEDIEDSDLGGGTGKSLIGVALSKMVPTTFMEGKTFDPSKGFAWQGYTLGDSIINIDDLNKKFSIELINSQITAGFTLERKNKPSVAIPAADSPKFYLTTNHVVDESAVHAKRRIRKLIVSPFFGKDNKPQDHFGHLFFEDWSTIQWDHFYSYMIFNISEYLSNPELEVVESDILVIKAFKSKYSTDLYDFLENAKNLDTYKNRTAVKEYWFPNFLVFSGQEVRTYSMKRFSFGLKEASESKLLFPSLKNGGGSRVSEYYFEKPELVFNPIKY